MQSYTAGDVVNRAAAFLNDADQEMYHFAVQLPYLKTAQDELEQYLVLSECQISLIDETIIPVDKGSIELILPASFFLPIKLQERTAGTTNSFIDMSEKRFVNQQGGITQSQALNIWDFRHNCINFIGATEAREVRLTYYRTLPPASVNVTTPQLIQAGLNTLAFRTAALCALYIGGNRERSNELNIEAGLARELIIGIFVKNNQTANRIRRKPFRIAWQRR